MKSKKISLQAFEKKTCFPLKNRRGVADIISTMLLMAITVTGASTLTYFMNDAFISGNLGTVSTLDSSSLNLLLLAYDTRDSFSLLSLTTVDNENVNYKFLCGSTCSGNVNAIPDSTPLSTAGGTEFIVLRIQNNGLNPVFLEDITINNVVHTWDSDTSSIPLDASANYLTNADRPYPADGTFSILPVGNNPILQNDSNQIQNGQIVNILIKLGADDSDIKLNKGIHVFFDIGAVHTVDFLIDSGDAR